MMTALLVLTAVLDRKRGTPAAAALTEVRSSSAITPAPESDQRETLQLTCDVCFILKCMSQDCTSEAKRQCASVADRVAASRRWRDEAPIARSAYEALYDGNLKRASIELGSLAKRFWTELGVTY